MTIKEIRTFAEEKDLLANQAVENKEVLIHAIQSYESNQACYQQSL